MYKNNSDNPFTWDIFSHQERKINRSVQQAEVADVRREAANKSLKKRVVPHSNLNP